jgi:hypothetical protein
MASHPTPSNSLLFHLLAGASVMLSAAALLVPLADQSSRHALPAAAERAVNAGPSAAPAALRSADAADVAPRG